MLGLGLGLQYLRGLIGGLSVLVQSIIDSLKSRGTIVENIEGTTTELVDLEDSGLLEKASILVTPTSVSPSLIHAAIPIPTFGPELIVNGGFDTDSDWTKGTEWIISDGIATCNSLGGFNTLLSNITSFEVGKKYIITFEIALLTSGSIKIFDVNNGTFPNSFFRAYSSIGLKSIEYFPTVNHNQIGFSRSSTEPKTFSIDNVSIKEIIVETADLNLVRATTATRVNKDGLIEEVGSNVPRIDFTDPLNPVILKEPQRTNLISNSDDLTATSWGNLNSSSSLVFVENPKGEIGSSEYSLFNYTGSSQYFRINPNATYDSGVEYTYSIFVKYSSFQFLKISYINFSTGDFTAVFDIINGVVTATNTNGSATNTSASITEYRDGWFRISITASLTSSAGDAMNFEVNKSPSGTPTFSVFGRINQTTTTGDKVYVWGAQLEKGSYPTSIIPTNGTALTRNADVISKTGIANYINSEEGVLFVEMAALSNDLTNRYISISGTNTSTYVILFYSSISNRITVQYRTVGFSLQCELNYTLTDSTDFAKIAFKWKLNDFGLWVNGTKVGTDFVGNVSPAGSFSALKFSTSNNADPFYGEVRNLQVYPTLTDAELITLTTQ